MAKQYPPEVAVSREDLMHIEHLALVAGIKHKVHSILAGQHASSLRGRGLDFAEVRQYVAGDDIRSIDWHVTARMGKTHSKVFNEEKERPVFAIVDQSTFMFFGSVLYTKSVIAAQVAALSGFHTVRSGDRFGGIVFDDEGFDHVIPRRSKAAVENFVERMVERNNRLPERKRVTSNRSILNENLKRASGLVTHDHVVTVISDFSDMDKETDKYLKGMARHNDVILVHISDPLDESLPKGRLVVSDGENQMLWSDRHHADGKYKEHFVKMRDDFPRSMLGYNIPVMQLDTRVKAYDQIMKILGEKLSA